MPNLLLVDDHAIIRNGMKMIIENFLPQANIHEAEDGKSALEKIKDNKYELLILDINMPGTDSLELISNILELKPASKILMLSMNSETLYARQYLKLGAKGYVRKDAHEDEIKRAIITVLNNKRYVSAAVSEILLKDLESKNNSSNPFDKLSPREFEIAQHLVFGDSLSVICQKLVLHASTVGTHKARLFEKLNCSNVIDLSTLAKLHNVNHIS